MTMVMIKFMYLCILNNFGLTIVSKNPTSFSSFHLVVAVKLFPLFISRQYMGVA